jgi:hypothetical protein
MPNKGENMPRFERSFWLRQLIGLGYQARTGKDSVADYLVQKHGFVKVPFALALKKACRPIFNLSNRQTDGDQKEVIDPYWGASPRELLQRIGTDAIRNHFDPDVWVKSFHQYITLGFYSHVVIPDVRFRNEADYVVAMGGTLVRCVCDGGSKLNEKRAAHVSETELDDYPWPHTIRAAYGDLGALYQAIEGIMMQETTT